MRSRMVYFRRVKRHGGSVILNIPSQIVEHLQLAPEDPVIVEYDLEEQTLTVSRATSITTTSGQTIPLQGGKGH